MRQHVKIENRLFQGEFNEEKTYSKELKAKVALAALKGHQTANEIASEFGVHVGQVNRWKKEAIEALPSVFGNTQAGTGT
jgi:transposase